MYCGTSAQISNMYPIWLMFQINENLSFDHDFKKIWSGPRLAQSNKGPGLLSYTHTHTQKEKKKRAPNT